MAPSAQLADIVRWLDEYLRIREVPDAPGAVNGLQVENRGAVGRIVAAVDASLATIQEAVGASRTQGRTGGTQGRKGARAQGISDAGTHGTGGVLLLVHHGLFWDGNVPVTGRRYRKLRALLHHDAALYSAHIPLDLHPEVGNNAVLARLLGLRTPAPFDTYQGVPFGVAGAIEPPLPREELAARLERLLGAPVRLIPGGPPECRRVGLITGGAGGRIPQAHAAGLDTFITGEGPHHTYFDAIELGVNALFAGHYATETVGVKALTELLAGRFGIPWEFVDLPTGM